MMNKANANQSGVVLVVSLIMLVLLTIIGVTAMQVSNMEEKMAGNSKDKNIAFQAAEAALRDAEQDISSSGRVSGVINMDNQCSNGLCYDGPDGIDDIDNDADKVAKAVNYGTYTGASAISGVASQPKYLIVGGKVWKPGDAGWAYIYTITAFAVGGSSNTQSVLEEIYVP